MAELNPNPKGLDQAYDLGFCDGSLIRESAATELIRLRAQVLDRCERCELHQAIPDLAAMTRQRDIYRWATAVLMVVALLFAGRS